MSLSIFGNRFAAPSLTKYYFHILHHFEYIILGSVTRLSLVVCLAFKMFAFLSYWVAHRKKSTVANVHNLSTFFQNYTIKVFKTVCACNVSLVCLA